MFFVRQSLHIRHIRTIASYSKGTARLGVPEEIMGKLRELEIVLS